MNERITGVVLAGGQSRRMGGEDKGLQLLNGKPMVELVLARLAPQVDTILISANQNLERYGKFGAPVVPDLISGFAGPLAGLHAALASANSPLLLSVPCDSPFFPMDLVQRMVSALDAENADIAIPRAGNRLHRAFSLLKAGLFPGLEAFLASGGRKVGLWQSTLNYVEVVFDDEAEGFANVNTLDELHSLQNQVSGAKDGAKP
jgi:molybdopterin-guanine dinucleotide biosynthesis protein A